MRSLIPMSGIVDRRGGGRDADKDGRASAWRRFDLELSTHEGGAFSHADQAKAGAGRFRWFEPDAVVLDDQRHVLGATLEYDVDAVGPRMFGHIVERFLRE